MFLNYKINKKYRQNIIELTVEGEVIRVRMRGDEFLSGYVLLKIVKYVKSSGKYDEFGKNQSICDKKFTK